MFSLLTQYADLLGWFAALSAVMFLLSLLGIPFVIVRIPADYFCRDRQQRTWWSEHHPFIRLILVALKNILGLVLLAAGIAMLILPGQGLLTIAVSLMLLDFPGKNHAERWMISRPPVLGTINWIRSKARIPPLRI